MTQRFEMYAVMAVLATIVLDAYEIARVLVR